MHSGGAGYLHSEVTVGRLVGISREPEQNGVRRSRRPADLSIYLSLTAHCTLRLRMGATVAITFAGSESMGSAPGST